MATIKIDQFHGIAPRIDPSLLADGMAVTAHNCRLKTGKLVPLRQPSAVRTIPVRLENGLSDVADAQSMHAWRSDGDGIELVAFPGVTWMADGNLADDDLHRVIVSGETGVGFTDADGKTWNDTPQVYFRAADGSRVIHPICKNPLPAPKVKRDSETPIGDDENRRYTYFFWTWVDKWGYESPVSEHSLAWDGSDYVDSDLEYLDGDVVKIAPLEAYELPDEAERIRVYKVVTGSEEGRIQFVREFGRDAAVAEAGMLVAVKDEDAGEVINIIESPIPDTRNIVRAFGSGAFYAGFSASKPKSVCFSDINLLYSWPVAYRYDVDYEIVALATTSNSVFALTNGYPYVISGTAPESMTVSLLAGPAACVSPRSVCVFRNAVYYASNEGICTIYNSADSGTVVQNLTEGVWTKEQWEELNPRSCAIVQHDGVLHCWFETASGGLSYQIDLKEKADAVTTDDEPASCACVDLKTDRLYFVRREVPNG